MITVQNCLQECNHAFRSLLDEVFITPISNLLSSFKRFEALCEEVIDSKALLFSPPEFLVSPSYDSHLQEIADKRNEAYSEIADIFEKVSLFKCECSVSRSLPHD